jgi:hypothetical protein
VSKSDALGAICNALVYAGAEAASLVDEVSADILDSWDSDGVGGNQPKTDH